MSNAVVKRCFGQISHVALVGEYKGYLQILAAKLLVTQQCAVGIVKVPQHLCAVHGGAKVNDRGSSLSNNAFEHQRAVCDRARKRRFLVSHLAFGVLVIPVPVSVHHGHVGISRQHLPFLFKFVFIRPEVIAGTIGNVFAAASLKAVIVIVNHPLVGSGRHQSDSVRVLLGIRLADVSCAVGRTVVAHHHLKGCAAALCKHRVECAGNSVLLIIRQHNDRYEWLFHNHVVQLLMCRVSNSFMQSTRACTPSIGMAL